MDAASLHQGNEASEERRLPQGAYLDTAPKFGEARRGRSATVPGAEMWKRQTRWNIPIAFGQRSLLRPGRPHSGGSVKMRPPQVYAFRIA
jgi:hypothetical protein